MQRHALFLVTPSQFHNDNHTRIPAYLNASGWQVTCEPHATLCLHHGQVCIGTTPLKNFELIWPIGFGPRDSYLDRMQLLRLIDQQRLINPVNAYANLHAKSAWLQHAPETEISNQPEPLIKHLHEQGGMWVLKPMAGSFGTDVHRITQAAQIIAVLKTRPGHYWMMQRYLDEIVDGECRTLICHDKIIGSYLRVPRDGLHANLAKDAEIRPIELTGQQQHLVSAIHKELQDQEVGFAAIDMVNHYLMEVNLANPGGLASLETLYDNRLENIRCLGEALISRLKSQR